MKKLLTAILVPALFVACAPKENNGVNSNPQRGLTVNNRMGGQNPQQQQLAALNRGGQNGPGAQTPNKNQPTTNTSADRFTQDLGFMDLKHSKVPEGVREAAKSVFQIRFLTISKAESVKVLVKSELRKSASALLTDFNKKNSDSFLKLIVKKQVEACLNNKKISEDSKCSIISEVEQGTGFLAGDGATLWTNAHVVKDYIETVIANEQTTLEKIVDEQKEVRVFIFNSDNQLILDPYTTKVTIAQLPEVTRSMKGNSFYGIESDYVVLSLAKEIGTPLEWAKKGASINTHVYPVGYPACTGCTAPAFYADKKENFESRPSGLNAPGQQIRVSQGRVVPADKTVFDLISFDGVSSSSIDQSKMLYMTADSHFGMSGSPVLNKRGQAIGILTGGASGKVGNKLFRATTAVIPNQVLTGMDL